MFNLRILCSVLAVAFATGNAGAQDLFPLEKVESHLDARGCLQYQATAQINAPIQNVFAVLSRPQKLWGYIPSSTLLAVFVETPYTYGNPRTGTGSDDSWLVTKPYAKILEWDGAPGLAESVGREEPRGWVEYRMRPETHTIFQERIGSTLPWSVANPHLSAEYELLPAAEKSAATSIHYSSSTCSPPAGQNHSPHVGLAGAQVESRTLGELLAVANALCHSAAELSSSGSRTGAPALRTPVPTPNP